MKRKPKKVIKKLKREGEKKRPYPRFIPNTGDTQKI